MNLIYYSLQTYICPLNDKKNPKNTNCWYNRSSVKNSKIVKNDSNRQNKQICGNYSVPNPRPINSNTHNWRSFFCSYKQSVINCQNLSWHLSAHYLTIDSLSQSCMTHSIFCLKIKKNNKKTKRALNPHSGFRLWSFVHKIAWLLHLIGRCIADNWYTIASHFFSIQE